MQRNEYVTANTKAVNPTMCLAGSCITQHLLADIERLREFLLIPAWIILGISWGSTLALAYAEAHPRRVAGLVLAAVTTTTEREVRWITEDMQRLFPAEWDRFAAAVPERLRNRRLLDAYAEMLGDPDPQVRDHAAREWCRWEDTHVSLMSGYQPSARYNDPEFRFVFARLVTHYWRHAGFLADGQLLRDASRLDGIPGALVHGRHDVSSPVDVAWRLQRRWPTSDLQVIDDAGHGGSARFTDAVVDSLARVALPAHASEAAP